MVCLKYSSIQVLRFLYSLRQILQSIFFLLRILSSWPFCNHKMKASSLKHKDSCFHHLQVFVRGNIVRQRNFYNIFIWRSDFCLMRFLNFSHTLPVWSSLLSTPLLSPAFQWVSRLRIVVLSSVILLDARRPLVASLRPLPSITKILLKSVNVRASQYSDKFRAFNKLVFPVVTVNIHELKRNAPIWLVTVDLFFFYSNFSERNPEKSIFHADLSCTTNWSCYTQTNNTSDRKLSQSTCLKFCLVLPQTLRAHKFWFSNSSKVSTDAKSFLLPTAKVPAKTFSSTTIRCISWVSVGLRSWGPQGNRFRLSSSYASALPMSHDPFCLNLTRPISCDLLLILLDCLCLACLSFPDYFSDLYLLFFLEKRAVRLMVVTTVLTISFSLFLSCCPRHFGPVLIGEIHYSIDDCNICLFVASYGHLHVHLMSATAYARRSI